MTNDDLEKKICKIIADNYLPKEMPDRLEDYKLYRFARAADALIAEGLCDKNTLDERYQTLMAAGFVQMASLRLDLEKVLHRAEVAERALKNLCEQYTGFTCAFCNKRFDDWNKCKHTKDDQNKCINEVFSKYIEEAEKELAEGGGKND